MLNNKKNEIIKTISLSILAIVMLYPLIWMLSSSFKSNMDIFTDPNLIPQNPTLQNYVQGWKGTAGVGFMRYMLNSLRISILSILGTVTTCYMAGFAFARLNFKYKKPLFALMLFMMMIPEHVVLLPQYVFFNALGWIDTILPLVIPKFFAVESFFIFLFIQFIRGIPRDLDDAATIDGCNKFRLFISIIAPLCKPAFITTIIFTFIWTWNDFFSQLVYLNRGVNMTVSLGLRVFLDATAQSAIGSLFAMSIVSIIPFFIIFIFSQKYLVQGIVTSGIKG